MFEIITKALAQQFGIEETTITRETDVREDLGADSLDIFEIVSVIEKEVGIKVPVSEITGLRTVGEIENYLNSKLN